MQGPVGPIVKALFESESSYLRFGYKSPKL